MTLFWSDMILYVYSLGQNICERKIKGNTKFSWYASYHHILFIQILVMYIFIIMGDTILLRVITRLKLLSYFLKMLFYILGQRSLEESDI